MLIHLDAHQEKTLCKSNIVYCHKELQWHNAVTHGHWIDIAKAVSSLVTCISDVGSFIP